MNKFIKKYKVAIIILIVLAIIFLLYALFSKKNNLGLIGSTPTPEPIPFALRGIIPTYGVGTKIIETSAIEFRFSKPLDTLSVNIKIDPEIEHSFELDEDNKVLFIRAVPWWKVGQKYTITVQVKSIGGEKLDKPIIYDLQIEQMKESELSEPYFPQESPTPKP